MVGKSNEMFWIYVSIYIQNEMLEWMSNNVNIMLPMNLRPTDGDLNCPNNSDFWRVMVPTPATWGLSADRMIAQKYG